MRTLLLLTAFLSITLSAQTIVITFEATLNGTPTALDSILVLNLTQGGDTTIYFPDNTLVLGTTGLGVRSSGNELLQCAPNPFLGTADILVGTAHAGELLVMVHDVMGRELVARHFSALPGQHRLRLTCALPGIHVLSVLQHGQRRSLRIIATDAVAGQAYDLTHLGSSGARGGNKNGRALFDWEAGDELRYIGYANNGGIVLSAAIDEAPTASSTQSFPLANGLVCPDSPTVTDIDGNVYPVVAIGDQCWMAQDLRAARYNDGSDVPHVTNDAEWTQITFGAWCNYANDPVNDAIYGKLYNGYTVIDPRNVCPTGWHVPTDDDWQLMELAMGMLPVDVIAEGERGAAQNVGGRLKAVSPLWDSPNAGANDASGFSLLPSGQRTGGLGSFTLLGYSGTWWANTEFFQGNLRIREQEHYSAGFRRDHIGKAQGFAIRCVRD